MILLLETIGPRLKLSDVNNKMTGEAAALRKIVEQCLDDNPCKRPPIRKVSTVIGPLKVSISD